MRVDKAMEKGEKSFAFKALGKRMRKLRGPVPRHVWGEIFDVPPSSLARWECGTSQPCLIYLVRLARYVGISVDELVFDKFKNAERATGAAMLTAQAIQRGKGKGRNPWLIRAFLSGKGMTMTSVAKLAGTWPQVVQETVLSIRNHQRTLNVLEELGCPPEYLYGQQAHKAGRAA